MREGQRLGNYEIVAPLGAGGMGEVYRAKDNRLGREVAVKVLPAAIRGHRESLVRFEREARALAALNHPNVATLHGLEESDGENFLVMELVRGETLAHRLTSGPVPIDEVIEIADQIADALDAAHQMGIVHRDLKPLNVMIGARGEVKLLDFGLSKLLQRDACEDDATMERGDGATTGAGMIMGTIPYMSPEQASGKPVDARTDIWSFGCVLYEMLTGERAFDGDSFAATSAAILTREPDANRLPEGLPEPLRRLLRRTLQKEPARRLRDIADVRFDLEEAKNSPAAAEPVSVSHRPTLRILVLSASAALFAGLFIGIATSRLGREAPSAPAMQLEIGIDEDVSFGDRPLALSPDGEHLVYSTGRQLYLRFLSLRESSVIAGTEGGRSPFFSPDGRWIGFWADGHLKKVPLGGGAPITLCPAMSPYGASWTEPDRILFGQGLAGVFEVSGDGGEPRLLLRPDSRNGEVSFHGPQLLPRSEVLLLTILKEHKNWSQARVVVHDLETGERRTLLEEASDGRYLPTGHLVFARENSLLAVPFDPETSALAGAAVPIVKGVNRAFLFGSGASHFTFSSNGTLAYLPEPPPFERSLVWVDREGNVEVLPVPRRFYQHPRLSPDGRLIVTDTLDTQDLWLYELERDALSRLTVEQTHLHPVWSADGRRVIFDDTQGHSLQWRALDSDRPSEVLLRDPSKMLTAVSVSPDGKSIAFEQTPDHVSYDIAILDLDGEATVRPWAASPEFHESGPMFSPDGRWIAFVSNQSGEHEVYVQAYPDGGRRWLVSNGGGREPLWSPLGDELFYRSGNTMMAVSVRTNPEFVADRPRQLFTGRYGREPLAAHPTYDVSRDGKRFLMVEDDGWDVPRTIHLMFQWTTQLESQR